MFLETHDFIDDTFVGVEIECEAGIANISLMLSIVLYVAIE